MSIVTNLSDDDRTAFFSFVEKGGIYNVLRSQESRMAERTVSRRNCLDQMNDDPFPVESGTFGKVDHVDDIGTVHCVFDNGRTLGVIPGVDDFHIVSEDSEQTEDEEMNMSM